MIAELLNISKAYTNPDASVRTEVLTNVDLALEKGKMISIVGPSGSGKSTLLNIIGTIDKPTSGIVKINGEDISDFTVNQLAEIRNKHIGFVFQSHHLLPQLNVIENVLLPTLTLKNKEQKNEARKRGLQLLEDVGLSDHIYKHPEHLSGGECQRVAVVRALINKPELILADEPTGSLDSDSAEKIGQLLSNISTQEGVTLVVVTHSLQLASTIGNVHNLSDGKLTPA